MGLQALRNTFSGARGALFAAPVVAGLALTSFAASADDAYAQEASTKPQPVASEQGNWTPELRELRAAEDAATDYAIKCFERGENCVGIVLHIGDDIYTKRDQLAKANNLPVETVEAYMVSKLEENYAAQFARYGVQVKMFPSANPGTAASGLAFHTNNILYETKDGQADMHFSTADAEIPNVVKSLQTLRQQASIAHDRIILANN